MKSMEEFEEFTNNSASTSYGSVLGQLTRLRQLAVHPDLPGFRKRQALERARTTTKLPREKIPKLIQVLNNIKENTKCSNCEVSKPILILDMGVAS